MGFESQNLTTFGSNFTAGTVGESDLVGSTGPPVSYAAVLNSVSRSYHQSLRNVAVNPEKKIDHLPNQKQPISTSSFPSFSIVRRFDMSAADKGWSRFESEIGNRASAVGMQALRLCELRVVLIDSGKMQAAMQKRFAYAAGLVKPGLRLKESRSVQEAGNRVVYDEKKRHNMALQKLTRGESYDVAERIKDPDNIKWLDFSLDEICDASASLDRPSGTVILNKADGLWQPYAPQIDCFAATGPRSYGATLSDPLRVLRTETEAIGKGLSAKNSCGFDSSIFHVPSSYTWKIVFANAADTDLRYLKNFVVPEIPYDIPLLPPELVSDDSR